MKNLMMKLSKMLNKTAAVSASIVFGAMVSQIALAQNDGSTIAVMNGQVHTVTGSIIQEGDVIVRNGEIIGVGSNLAAPDGATIIDATGKTVTPGIISPYSTIGLVEIGAVAESNDARIGAELTLGAALNAADAYNPASTLIAVNRAGGVTRAVSVPPAGASIFGGEAIMVDMTGRNRSITKSGLGRSLELGFGGARRTGNTRLGLWATLREILDAAIAYGNNPGGYNERDSEGRYTIADLKALLPIIRGEQKLLVTINRASDIRNLIKLKNNYRLDVVIVGANEAWREARALAAANIPVILDPLNNLPSQFENLSATVKNASLLNQAGVVIAFYNTASGTHNIRLHTQQAGNAVANGLPFDAALAALTINPAKIYGLDERLGTIEVGKRADLVVWDGDPLELSTRPVAVLIDGQQQSLQNRQNQLLQRYRNLERGDLPHAYRGGN